ncbi:MAG: SDR family oxidoreductase [Ilumatobacteraceae bacterium]|nr:SDR family oxidoreductase [Ilumatobacteraceae bacterium]
MGEFDGRVALVTGGGRGIGRAISERLAADGAAVAVNYRRDADSAHATVDAIVAAGGVARPYLASIDDPAADAAMVEQITAELGPVDLLVCNAGIASQRSRPRGDIVMISSVATSHMGPNGAPYNMGKAALEALARTLAKEERPFGIHVNVVAPGLVETDMGVRLARALTGQRDLDDLRSLDAVSPFGRVCQPDDVAAVVAFLCSEGAGYVTGQRVEVDGGGPTR